MNCASCGHNNPPASRFCLECGAPLGLQCSGCSAELPAAAKFCNACGRPVATGASPTPERAPRDYTPKHLAEKILRSKSALEGERKQVTVLFADVKRSMELAERLDPEEWHRILDRFFQVLSDGVHRFEGTINQYTGDGIMALFGAPIAHEDHAQRACYAALYLRDALRRYADELRVERGLDLSTRMGINSGEVIVGKIGDDLRMDYTAQGHTVGLAQRMEQLAASDKVYLAQSTARLVEGFVQVRSLGKSAIQGVTEPVGIYELENAGPARSRLDVARLRGFTRFVGRQDEVAILEVALQRAAEGHGQVVGVVGEAGVGKSRLCAEFVGRCRERGTRVLEAHCPAYGKVVPLVPILELLRASFAITDQDNDQVVREKIAGRLLLLDEAFREVLPIVFDFLGVADPARPSPQIDPEARQRQLFAFIRRLVHARSEEEPAVLFLDDLHWIDRASEGFLAQLVEATGSTRTLLLMSFRPEHAVSWSGRTYYQQLPLTPLGPEDVAEMVANLLGSDDSVAPLRALIQEKAGGNPFFTEEVVLSLVESGALEGGRGAYRLVRSTRDLEVPATVQALLAARIDRLSEREKQVLHTAAVIGREFSEPLLSAVVDLPAQDLASCLSCLESREFIVEQAAYPVAEYVFKHSLTEEVARESQLQDRRRHIHATVARATEELHAGELDERAALIAHHWEAAGAELEAARWHARAARWVGLSDPAETTQHWRQVRSLLEGVPESSDTCALGVAACLGVLVGGWRMGMPEDEVEAVFTEGRKLARRSGDLPSECLMVAIYATFRGGIGDVDQYVDRTLEAARLAERLGDPETIRLVDTGVAYALFSVGRLDEAWGLVVRALDSRPEHPRPVSDSGTLSADAWMEAVGQHMGLFLGRLDAGRLAQQRGTELAQRLGDQESLGWGYGYAAYLAEFSGETRDCVERSREGFEIAERIGSNYSRVYASGRLGLAHLVREEWTEATELLERALDLARRHRVGLEAEAEWLSYLAMAQLGLGSLQVADQSANEAIALAQGRGTRSYEIPAQLARARVLRQSEGGHKAHEIESALARVQSLIEETGARAYQPFVHEERAELARLRDDNVGREHELHEAHRLHTEMGATGHAERLARELGL